MTIRGPALARLRYPNGTLLRGSDTTVYLLQHGRRRPIPSVQVFQSWGYQWDHVVEIDDAELVRYPMGESLTAQKSMFQCWRALRMGYGLDRMGVTEAVTAFAGQMAA